MRFFKKYNEIYGINENAAVAKKILQENDIDSSNPDFIELRELLKKTPNYLGLFTKFVFEDGVTLDQVKDVLNYITYNKGTLSNLPKPVIEYTDYHNLLDDLQKLDKERLARKILNNVMGDLRRELFELDPEKLKPYINLAATIAEMDEKEVKVFTKSIARSKDLEDLIMDMELFIQKMGEDDSVNKIKAKVENTEFSKVVYEDKKIIVARIGEFIDSYYLGSYNWCISKDGGVSHWNQYVEKEGNVQYFAWDLSRHKSDPLYMVGVTVTQKGEITESQDAQNNHVDFEEFIASYGLTGKKIFVGLTKKELAEKKAALADRQERIAEFEAKMVEEKAKRRAERMAERRADADWESDPTAHAMREYLVDAGIMDEAEDVYALEEEGYDYYGLRQFRYDGMTYAIGTDEEADAAAIEDVKGLIDEIGIGGQRYMIEDHLDKDAIVRDFGYDYEYVSESPESYFDKEMKPGVEEQKEALETEMAELVEKQSELEDGAPEYDELQEKIDQISEKISEMEDEDNDEYWGYPEDKYQEKVDELNQELEEDPLSALEDRGMVSFDKKTNRPTEESGTVLAKYIDKDSYAEYCVNTDGRGHILSGYDGEENEVDFEGTTYYIYRVD